MQKHTRTQTQHKLYTSMYMCIILAVRSNVYEKNIGKNNETFAYKRNSAATHNTHKIFKKKAYVRF